MDEIDQTKNRIGPSYCQRAEQQSFPYRGKTFANLNVKRFSRSGSSDLIWTQLDELEKPPLFTHFLDPKFCLERKGRKKKAVIFMLEQAYAFYISLSDPVTLFLLELGIYIKTGLDIVSVR